MLPVQWNAAGFGEIVAGTRRYQAESRAVAGTQYAVDGFVNAAVSTSNDDSLSAPIDVLADPLFKIAYGFALMQFNCQVPALQQLEDACLTTPGTTPTCGWVEKQVNCLCGHICRNRTSIPDATMRATVLATFSRDKEALMLELGVKFLISYFIGSLMGAMIVGRLRGGVDIRTMGSGNAGGTNALRTQGVWFAFFVVVIDVGKGAIGAGVVPGLDIPFVPADPEISRTWLAMCCAAAAVIGHVWPIYHGFQGGKGGATLVGTLAVLAPSLIVVALLVWAIVVGLSGYVGLATMSASSSLPVWLAITRLPDDQPLFIYSVVMAGFIIYCHRANIQRLRDGVENRHLKMMLLRSKKSRTADDES